VFRSSIFGFAVSGPVRTASESSPSLSSEAASPAAGLGSTEPAVAASCPTTIAVACAGRGGTFGRCARTKGETWGDRCICSRATGDESPRNQPTSPLPYQTPTPQRLKQAQVLGLRPQLACGVLAATLGRSLPALFSGTARLAADVDGAPAAPLGAGATPDWAEEHPAPIARRGPPQRCSGRIRLGKEVCAHDRRAPVGGDGRRCTRPRQLCRRCCSPWKRCSPGAAASLSLRNAPFELESRPQCRV
jgi:hypothetical protein